MRERRRPIVDDWLMRTRALASARRLDTPALIDHIPDLLERLGALAEDIATRGTGTIPTDLAERHGVERLADGFDLAEVLLEYSVLRDCLLRAWESRKGGSVRAGSSALSQAVDAAASASVDGYTQARDRTLKAVDRVSAAALESRGLDDLLTRILRAVVETEPAVATGIILLRDGALLRGRAAQGVSEELARRLTVRMESVLGEDGATPRRSARLHVAEADILVKEQVPGIRAVVGIPLVDGRELVGVAHLGSTTAFDFADQDMHLFEAIANRATSAIFQQLLRQDAERRVAELDAVIESIPAAIYIGDERGIARSNRKGLEILGHRSMSDLPEPLERRAERLDPRDSATGQRIPHDDLPFSRALAGESNSREMILRDARTGDDVYVKAIAAPIRDADAIVGAVAVNHDVTEHVRALQKLRLSEERLLLALEVTKLGTWEWDVLHGDLSWSPRCREIHGIVTAEQLTYPRFLEVIHPDDRDRIDEAVARAVAAGGDDEYDVEYRVVRPGGEVRWVAARGRCLREGGATAVRMLGTALDVTERRRDLEAGEFLSEAGRVLVASLDPRETLGRIAKLAVPRLADWCGVEVVEHGKTEALAVEHVDPSKVALARTLRERYGPSSDETRGLSQVLRTGVPELYEEITDELIRETARDARHAELLHGLGLRSAMVVPMTARERTVGVLTFGSSESGRRFTRRDLEVAEHLASSAGLALDNARLFQESQAATHAREEILAVVSHDLRSPLGTIVMASTVLLELHSAAPAARKQVELVQRSARRMERLIEDLLDFASIQGGRLTVEMRRTDAGALVREAVEAAEMNARAKELTLRSDIQVGGVEIQCDRDRLLQALGNLLGNSIKFCRPGETVTVRADVIDGQVRIFVADTGPGIRAEDLPHVFESHWSAPRHARRGNGLGLFITRGIVEAHGGQISVASEPGSGTSVEILLPRKPPSS